MRGISCLALVHIQAQRARLRGVCRIDQIWDQQFRVILLSIKKLEPTECSINKTRTRHSHNCSSSYLSKLSLLFVKWTPACQAIPKLEPKEILFRLLIMLHSLRGLRVQRLTGLMCRLSFKNGLRKANHLPSPRPVVLKSAEILAKCSATQLESHKIHIRSEIVFVITTTRSRWALGPSMASLKRHS